MMTWRKRLFVPGASNDCNQRVEGNMRIRYGVILAVIGIFFFFCMEGWGADWKFMGRDIKGSLLEIDVASISHQPNNVVRVLVKHIRSKESVTDWVREFGEQYKDFSYSVDLEEYDCTERKGVY